MQYATLCSKGPSLNNRIHGQGFASKQLTHSTTDLVPLASHLDLTKETKLRIHNITVKAILKFDSEAWVLKKKMNKDWKQHK
jgi:hypothetical protein